MSDASRHQQVMRLFDEVCDMSAASRAAFLDDVCANDPELRREVESLVAHDRRAIDVVEAAEAGGGAGALASSIGSESDADVPDRIGPYTLGKEIGRGGMGVVYEAQQTSPNRRVALKLIRGGFATAGTERRFKLEAEVLGRLQHAGIAHIYDAGIANAAGRSQPYLAMELVDGAPLTEFVRAHRLSAREILALAARLCDAVHHAHQKGVIHRDLKPENVLVVEHASSEDAVSSGDRTLMSVGQPKVLDFGVARLIDPDAEAVTQQTNVGQLVGTLGYMSPEQLAGDPSAIDTRSDVYALGVMLYRLLAGRMPHDFSGKPLAEAARITREIEPPRLKTVNRAYRGDIDTIVTKAIATDPDRRYESAAALADDVRRFLSDEPIAAHPPSAAYTLRKFARRNRGLVSGAGLALVALVGGTLGMGFLYAEASAQRDRAETSLQLATVEAAKSKQVADLMTEMLSGVGPSVALGRDTTMLREIMDRAAERVDDALLSTPEVEATMRETIAAVYRSLSEFEQAERHQQRALELRESLAEPIALAMAKSSLGKLRWLQGRIADSEALYRAALDVLRPHTEPDDPEYLTTACRHAFLVGENGDYPRAIDLYRTHLQPLKQHGKLRDILGAMSDFGVTLAKSGALDESEVVYRELLKLAQDEVDPRDPIQVNTLISLGMTQVQLGAFQEAEQTLAQAYQAAEAIFGPDHRTTLGALNNLGMAKYRLGKRDDVITINRDILERRRRILGDNHHETINAINNVAFVLLNSGDIAGAEPFYREALERRIALHGPKHPAVAAALGEVGWLLDRKGEHAEALGFFNRALDLYFELGATDRWRIANMRLAIGKQHRRLGQFDLAESTLRTALAEFEQALGSGHWRTADAQAQLAACLLERGDAHDEPRDLLESARASLALVPNASPALNRLIDELLDSIEPRSQAE